MYNWGKRTRWRDIIKGFRHKRNSVIYSKLGANFVGVFFFFRISLYLSARSYWLAGCLLCVSLRFFLPFCLCVCLQGVSVCVCFSLWISLFPCLFACLCIRQPVFMISVCLSVFLMYFPSLPVCVWVSFTQLLSLPVLLSVCLSVYLSQSLCLFPFLSVYIFVSVSGVFSAYPTVCLPIYIPISLSVSLPFCSLDCLSVHLSVCFLIPLSVRLRLRFRSGRRHLAIWMARVISFVRNMRKIIQCLNDFLSFRFRTYLHFISVVLAISHTKARMLK